MNESQDQHPVHYLGEPCSTCIAQTKHKMSLGILPKELSIATEKVFKSMKGETMAEEYVRQHLSTKIGEDAVHKVQDLSIALDNALEANQERVSTAHKALQARDEALEDANNLRERYAELQTSLHTRLETVYLNKLERELADALRDKELLRMALVGSEKKVSETLREVENLQTELVTTREILSGYQVRAEKAEAEVEILRNNLNDALQRLDTANEKAGRMQYACGVAALGGTQKPAVKGEWGWSQSYQDVLDLRLSFEQCQTDRNDWSASSETWRHKYEDAHNENKCLANGNDDLQAHVCFLRSDKEAWQKRAKFAEQTLAPSQENERILLDRAEQAEERVRELTPAAAPRTEWQIKYPEPPTEMNQQVWKDNPETLDPLSRVPMTTVLAEQTAECRLTVAEQIEGLETWKSQATEAHGKVVEAAEALLDWCPTCSVNSSGYLRQERLKKAILESGW